MAEKKSDEEWKKEYEERIDGAYNFLNDLERDSENYSETTAPDGTSVYKHKNKPGLFFKRVTQEISEFFSKRKIRDVETTVTNIFISNNKNKDTDKCFYGSEEYTFDEMVKKIENVRIDKTRKGRIIHKIIQINIMKLMGKSTSVQEKNLK